ncbi:MAG: hypothetical protein RJB13_241 [Pseudomonadota bacterium]|jgi:putative oxidoreductase
MTNSRIKELAPDVGLLVLRLFFGISMALAHGLPKLQRFSELQTSFPDPLGMGSLLSLSLAIFAELACALAVALGFLFRLSLLPLIITMVVAAFIVHGHDPFNKQELALAYLTVYVALIFAGPGRFSVDSLRQR